MPPPPSVLSRLFGPVRHVGPWVRGAPRWIQATALLLVLAVASTGGYAVVRHRTTGRQQHAVSAGWAQFDAAVRSGKESEMRAGLDAVLAADPGNAIAVRRKHALDAGDGDPDDGPMLPLTVRLNLRANDFAGADREAAKLLAREPKDWFARCARAAAALRRGDRPGAARELDALPPPDDPVARLDPAGLLFAFQLFRATGRDSTPLRSVVQNHLVLNARSPIAQGLPPAEKLGLVECYAEGFEPAVDRPQPVPLLNAWVTMAALADRATDEAVKAGVVPVIGRAGRLGAALDAALRLFHRNGQVSDAQYADLRAELDARTRRAWGAVRDREPNNPEAYRGLALAALRADDWRGAVEWTVQGLSACEADPDLGALFGRMLQRAGQPLDAWAWLAAAARTHPDKPVWWALAADAAVAAGRRDYALDACAELRTAAPGNRWVVRTEAKLLVAAGDAARAVDLLRPLGEPAVAADPDLARTYAHALALTASAARADEFLSLAEQASVGANTPAPVTAALSGCLDAPPDPARDAAVAARADSSALTDRWPDDAGLLRARAAALTRVAEYATPAWDTVRVAAAVRAGERFRARFPDDPDAAAWLATLRLYGSPNPNQALRDLAPLGEAAPADLLGQAYRRAGKPADAARVLERAARGGQPTAGAFTQLALVYHAQGRAADARTALRSAQVLPRTPREHADYVAAVQTLGP